MGKDSIEPFLEYDNKHTILLSLTSNSGSSDFQFQSEKEHLYIYLLLKRVKIGKIKTI